MKMSIAWHRKCLENALAYEKSQRENLDREKAKLLILERSNRVRAAQISRAEREGRDGFDSDKFQVVEFTINGVKG